jgi:hypothetical protein
VSTFETAFSWFRQLNSKNTLISRDRPAKDLRFDRIENIYHHLNGLCVMQKGFENIIAQLVGARKGTEPLTGIQVKHQFRPDDTATTEAAWRNLNAAFLISLCGSTHPDCARARQYLAQLKHQSGWKGRVGFYEKCISRIDREIRERLQQDKEFHQNFDRLQAWIGSPGNLSNPNETQKRVWNVFFPEGVPLLANEKNSINALRQKRSVRITRLNPQPINDPANEILFTSNVLLTVPAPGNRIDDLDLPKKARTQLSETSRDPQRYWYDHPIQMGVEIEKNEIAYGLCGLDQAVAFEKKRGVVDENARVHCVLSVSVTHEGLHELARPYVEAVLKRSRPIRHLRISVLTESDVSRLVDEILDPACRHYLGPIDTAILRQTVGVDGEYGRHYTLLKSISAFWQVFLNPALRGTFKIDLDQVFPEDALVKETGLSALEHLKTPLWGAEGTDADGNAVKLGMIAGALVNAEDIAQSVFTPDVTFSADGIDGDQWIFCSALPQAVSTEAEMMCRYAADGFDGRQRCIQRVHVTGGTCGILVEDLRRFRPFTPGFMGRAEDQAFLLSVLSGTSKAALRYVHKDGLMMRHDKQIFAGEAIRAARIGKLVGDYMRILMFSYYARALPWPVGHIKQLMDPFTGCFISLVPFTVVCLRFALKAASFFREGETRAGCALLQLGVRRLDAVITELEKIRNPLADRFRKEKEAWGLFFDVLDKVEAAAGTGDPFALELKERASRLMEACEIDLEGLRADTTQP